MHEIFNDCMADSCSVVLVEGTVGCGKTSELQAFAEYALGRGATVLSVSCAPLESEQQFGAVRELLEGAETAPGVDVGRSRQLAEETLTAATLCSSNRAATLTESRHTELALMLRSLAEHRPVVITVDDAQHLDVASARCLVRAMRKTRFARVTLVVAHSTVTEPTAPFFVHELLRLPQSRSLRLGLLDESKVRELLQQAAQTTGRSVDPEACAATGGNRLLVQAVAEDLRNAGEPAPGEHFARAVLAVLHRTGERITAIARGAAVLGPHCTPLLLGRVLDMEPAAARDGLAALEGVGLMAEGQFRHPAAAAAVLDEMRTSARSELHLRAADLLFDQGVPATALADQLVAAGNARSSWTAALLREAARTALAEGTPERAEQYLELATWTGTDEQDHQVAKVMLLEIAWRRDPARVDHHVPYLMTALRRGKLGTGSMLTLVKHLLWRGRTAEAVEVLTALGQASAEPAEAASIESLRLSLSHTFPPLAALLKRSEHQQPDPAHQPLLDDAVLRDQAAGRLAALMANRAEGGTVAGAAYLLRSSPLTNDLTFESSRLALLTLIYADQLGEASRHCDALLKDIDHRAGPTWSATLHAIRAEIALRTGALPMAQRLARKALTLLPKEGWGVVVGMPLATLIAASVAMGDLKDSAALAYQPIPPAMLMSRHGLPYLYARGHHHLATGAVGLALADFQQCGQLMRSWEVDMPTLAPWRSGAAAAYLAMGRKDAARALAEDELALLAEGDYPRARGIAARALATSIDDPGRSVQLLETAAALLESVGDQYEYARSLLELGAAYTALGESRQARLQTRMGLTIACRCGAGSLSGPPSEAPAPAEAPGDKALTHAESRVAVLAARGHTNREIAEQLQITPSTVEQHLTRVFRKLDVRRRQDLPVSLGLPDQTAARHPMPKTPNRPTGRPGSLPTPRPAVR